MRPGLNIATKMARLSATSPAFVMSSAFTVKVSTNCVRPSKKLSTTMSKHAKSWGGLRKSPSPARSCCASIRAVHARAAALAEAQGKSLNAWAQDLLQKAVTA